MQKQRLPGSSSTTPFSYALPGKSSHYAAQHMRLPARAQHVQRSQQSHHFLLVVVGGLLALMPFSGVFATWLHQPELPAFLPLAFVPILLLLMVNVQRRAAIHLNAVTAGVVAYAVLGALSLSIGPHTHLLAAFTAVLVPLALFFIGMMLPLTRRSNQQAYSEPHTGIMYTFGWLAIGAGLALALLTLGLAQWYRIQAVPPTPLLPDAFALANLLGLVLVLSMSWDARQRYWLMVLGHASPYLRVTLAIGLPFYLLALGGALALTWSNNVLIAVAIALLGVSLARRRLSEVAILSVLAMPFLALSPHAPSSSFASVSDSWLSATQHLASTFFNATTWNQAFTNATATPLGAGIATISSSTNTADASRSQYLVTLQTLGLPGLAALLSLLGITLYQCWHAYRRLRPTSAEAGSILAAWGMTIFVVVAGIATAPLNQPLPSLFFWLFLGFANATIGTLAHSVGASKASATGLRGYPLRIGYLIRGNTNDNAAIAIYEHLSTLDRRHITPLVLSLGAGSLATMIRGTQVHTHLIRRASVPQHFLPMLSSSSDMWLLWQHWFTQLGPIASLCDRAADLSHAWSALVEWARITRTLLEMDLDLLVSSDEQLHLYGLFAGRLAGVPVQWRIRERAPAKWQFLLDTLAPWTDGVLAESQTLARSFNLRMLGNVVRVLRPSISVPPQPTADHIAALRQAVGAEDEDLVVTVLGTITPDSGSEDMLEAASLLIRLYPHLCIIFASAALPGSCVLNKQGHTRMERLQSIISMRRLDSMICSLGPREDIAALLAASDIIALPQWYEQNSRNTLLAMAVGKPIVATYSGVFPELLEGAWGCQLVPVRTPVALASAIATCLENLESYQAEARRNPMLMCDWYAPELESSRLLGVYQRVCQPVPRSRKASHQSQAASAYSTRRPAASISAR